LGRGAFKDVYKAFDSDTGITVAWNEVNITPLPASEKRRVISEVKILEKVEHKRIIGFYGSWYNKAEHKVVFITEIVTEGTLRGFCERVNGLKISVVRKWADQILDGLIYLHGQTPPIIHRDLKCENVFVKGEDGSIKIGDLGLSTQAMRDKASPGTVLGTPEFMAPELYTEHYDQTVDVYAFGLVILEMVSMETPYSECTNIGQIITKVTQGQPPEVLERVKIKSLQDFINFCLTKQMLPAHVDDNNQDGGDGSGKAEEAKAEEAKAAATSSSGEGGAAAAGEGGPDGDESEVK
jgi:WNK lysine deficient protein kinase